MENADLLKTFNEHLTAYTELRGFIGKAKAQGGKFSAATIEKVVMKNEIKSVDVGDLIRPLVGDVAGVIDGLAKEVADVNERKSSAAEEMEELELRKEIGELTAKQFDKEAKAFKKELSEADGKVGELQKDLDEFRATLDAWVDLAAKAAHDSGVADAPQEIEIEIENGDADDVHAHSGGMKEDVSAVFDDGGSAAAVAVSSTDEDAEISIEASESDADDEEAVDVDFGFEADDEDVDILADDGADEVEIDLVGADDLEPDDEIGLEDVEEIIVEGDTGGAEEGEVGTRRALLIYQEGTAEEQIYPFTGDVLTIGRGRDNDIQIKNDSKVSRYHCKVFRRGDNFYIEDNKSSNGSLVNGELITERRLFGGEEVIIGETFFRFRIMD
ncbi:MAG TPA: FHA domain-containing protein [Myxococcota bacterium]|nr:FHA domain-containing protein [Myxococcota bacterium]